MRFVALVSGGKDSIYSILECIRNGHQLIACVHLGRPDAIQEESYMYQTAASEVVRTLVEDCLGVPLLLYKRLGTSVNTSLVYDGTEQPHPTMDEVEDLYVALQTAQELFNNTIEAVCSGAILSTYQRVRIENVCSRLGLTSLSYLWRLLPQKELLQQMLQDQIEAVLVRVACPPGLIPQRHLNKSLRYLWETGLLEQLHQKYQFHVCGEGGEYESLVLDSPLHQKKLVLDLVEIDQAEDGVGDLKILQCHAEPKTENDVPILWNPFQGFEDYSKGNVTYGTSTTSSDSVTIPTTPLVQKCSAVTLLHIPSVKYGTGGLFHVNEIMASVAAVQDNATEAVLAVQEAKEVLTILQKTLEIHGSSAKDVLFVHLYLSEISHFANINNHYQEFFGTILPPSRSCVAVGKGVLPGGRRVLLDCLVQPGSGEYMRISNDVPSTTNPYASAAHATKTSKLRQVLHVQSISHWAPVCVGPYSQVNTLRSGLHFFAGQIGLIPATMQLHPTWQLQLQQCWTNVASVLDALDGASLKEMIAGIIYVSNDVREEQESLALIESITDCTFQDNGKIVPGRIDALVDSVESYGGYEDAETWEEMKAQQREQENNNEKDVPCPILVLSIPEMPKGATVEVEIIAATKMASKNLELLNSCHVHVSAASKPSITNGWDTGHAFTPSSEHCNAGIQIRSLVHVLGHQNAAISLVTASVDDQISTLNVQDTELLSDMLAALSKGLADARTGFHATEAIHLRLFHTATVRSSSGTIEPRDDGFHIRLALQSAIATWAKDTSPPSSSVIPVHAIDIINTPLNNPAGGQIFLAIQAQLVDPVHLETDIWINNDREYN